MQRQKNIELRVGVFVFTALVIGAALVFIIGDQRNMFESKKHFRAAFTTVGGLAGGSPVRLAGVSVGSVSKVKLGDNGKIYVTFDVAEDASGLIRTDSFASLGNKGLLGDRIIEISVGKANKIREWGWIPTKEPADLSEYLQRSGEILADIQATARNIKTATQPLGDPKFGQEIRDVAHNLSVVLDQATNAGGPISRLLSDRKMGEDLSLTMSNASKISTELTQTSKTIRTLMDEIQHGKGTVHDLIYGDSGAKLARNLAEATGELAIMLRQIRTGDGTAHELIYGNKAEDILKNLNSASTDLKVIMSDIRSGKGTLGAFLQDPSIYDDVKRLVGDLQRNSVLRALIRYSIRNSEEKPTSKSVQPAAK